MFFVRHSFSSSVSAIFAPPPTMWSFSCGMWRMISATAMPRLFSFCGMPSFQAPAGRARGACDDVTSAIKFGLLNERFSIPEFRRDTCDVVIGDGLLECEFVLEKVCGDALGGDAEHNFEDPAAALPSPAAGPDPLDSCTTRFTRSCGQWFFFL
jgi:hypothetical protein